MSIFFFGQEFFLGVSDMRMVRFVKMEMLMMMGMSGWMGMCCLSSDGCLTPNAPDGIYRSAANLLPSLAPSFCKASQKRKSNMLFKERQHIIFLEIKGCATNLHIPRCSLYRSLSALAGSIYAFHHCLFYVCFLSLSQPHPMLRIKLDCRTMSLSYRKRYRPAI